MCMAEFVRQLVEWANKFNPTQVHDQMGHPECLAMPHSHTYLEAQAQFPKGAALRIGDHVVLADCSVAAGAADEGGISWEALGEHEVGGEAAGVEGDADVEAAAEVVEVALEEAAVGHAWNEKNRAVYWCR